jgi:hypothetical protein
MYFSIIPPVAILVVAWILLVVLNAVTWSAVLRTYEPYGHSGDTGGPYCNCATCCGGPCGSKPGRRGCCKDCDGDSAATPPAQLKQVQFSGSGVDDSGSEAKAGSTTFTNSDTGSSTTGSSAALAQV